jgi:hypothetical protein
MKGRHPQVAAFSFDADLSLAKASGTAAIQR